MRVRRSSYLYIAAVVLFGIGLVAPVAKADSVTYYYTGTDFTTCTYAVVSCPANFTSDYLVASLTFSTALPANLSDTDTSAETAALSTLTAWSVSDALGNFSYSSATTPTFLTGFSSEGAPPLEFSTDSLGNITDYFMGGFPEEILHIAGATEFLITNPPIPDSESPVPLAEVIQFNNGGPNEWDVVSGTPGTWTKNMPEPSTLLLAMVGIALVALGNRKFRVQPAA